jgi:hypothetical protein
MARNERENNGQEESHPALECCRCIAVLVYIRLNIFSVCLVCLPCEQERRNERGVESKIIIFHARIFAKIDKTKALLSRASCTDMVRPKYIDYTSL